MSENRSLVVGDTAFDGRAWCLSSKEASSCYLREEDSGLSPEKLFLPQYKMDCCPLKNTSVLVPGELL